MENKISSPGNFNVRVYGILIDEQKRVLVSDEYIRGSYYTKFPGGGLEIGEGTRDCLKREFKEEMDLEVEIGEHLYTTDFYQVSAFNPAHQIISIYYLVRPLEEIKVSLRTKEFDFDEQQMETYNKTRMTETFRFISWEDFSAERITLPIDKVVASLVKEKYR
ncbi:MAG TPA: NUDIX domain-containing protein [Chitinophagaceae bacterium]|nr:NUDIX domain-containing protein [Chitinophagaceae bacterium]